jgi:hypothetical protein
MRIACALSEKAPEITACEAMTVAIAASSTIGSTPHAGNIRKKGLSMAVGLASTSAPWPK